MNLGPQGIFSLGLARCSKQPVLLKKGTHENQKNMKKPRSQNVKVANVTKSITQSSTFTYIDVFVPFFSTCPYNCPLVEVRQSETVTKKKRLFPTKHVKICNKTHKIGKKLRAAMPWPSLSKVRYT